MAIVLDLETLAIPNAADYVEPVTAPRNYQDPAKIAAYIAEAEEKQIRDAALYPYTCRILALGWCEERDEVEHVETCGSEAAEVRVLTEFWQRVTDEDTYAVRSIVTFNGLGFDLPVLLSRSRLLGVRAPDLNLDRYRSPHPDLLQRLTYRGAIQARSLRWFAKRFGLDTSDAFSGKEIAGLYEDGNWDAIKAHCASDVRLTRHLAERIGVLTPRRVAV